MPNCGTQVVLCDLPIRFDTYKGCSHQCKYCFVQGKTDLSNIGKGETVKSLRDFIEGKRTKETRWCDWDIPLHWGGMSDPFQPIEKKHRLSYECLKLFKETQYPFVVSTKGKLICDDEYLELIKDCNCVIQISLVCSEYDRIELGAPTYAERLEMVRTLAKYKRVNARIQPYMIETHESTMNSIRQLAEAGAHGIIVEGMKFRKRKDGLVKVGADYCYPMDELGERFAEIKAEAHRLGVKFYSGENRLRSMGDHLCCCGIEGLEGFRGNNYNLNNIINGHVEKPTERMREPGTAGPFVSMYQMAGVSQYLKGASFKDMMLSELANKPKYYMEMFGQGVPNR